ncbi:MAG TPA: YbaN family protein [Candidatus Dorea intestinavium]|nr:YbaN family protein [Candidatus Dorea intestinavium]
MMLKKTLLVILGCLSLAMGVVGAILPLLPAFPFLLLTAFCFGKSSKRLNNWFINTKLYKNNLESYIKGEGMTSKTKVKVMITVTLVMSVGFFMMRNMPLGQIILTFVWIFHLIYFGKIVKLKEASQCS